MSDTTAALFNAVDRLDLEAMTTAVRAGADLDALDGNGLSPLWALVYHRTSDIEARIPCIEFLLECGANPLSQDIKTRTEVADDLIGLSIAFDLDGEFRLPDGSQDMRIFKLIEEWSYRHFDNPSMANDLKSHWALRSDPGMKSGTPIDPEKGRRHGGL